MKRKRTGAPDYRRHPGYGPKEKGFVSTRRSFAAGWRRRSAHDHEGPQFERNPHPFRRCARRVDAVVGTCMQAEAFAIGEQFEAFGMLADFLRDGGLETLGVST